MNLNEMTKEELLIYIESLNEEQTGKLGLVWDREKVPEDIVVQCKKNIPILESTSAKNIIKCTNDSRKNNILIEGDNFHSLSVLSYTHNETVDIIYIDPPYNTGSEDFVYNDNFVNEEDGYRHSKWLNFMDKRLKIAKRLLKMDGIICISIDDNEIAQLQLLCDSIFGEFNRLSTQHIQVRYDNKSLNEKNDWQPVMEYILIYAKNKSCFKANKPYKEYDVNNFVYSFEEIGKGEKVELGNKKVTIFRKGEWKLNKHTNGELDLLKETWASGSVLKGNTSGKFFDLHLSKRKDIDGLNCLYKVEGIGEDGLGFRYFTGPQKDTSKRGKFYSGIPLNRIEEIKLGESKKYSPITNFYDYSGDFGNIRNEGGVSFNSGKKPIKMIKELINYHQNKNALVLDFFAGSGSTGHAVLSLNEEDGGHRRFILCTNNEVSRYEEKEFMKLHKLTENQLIEMKATNNDMWKNYTLEKGICENVTLPRMYNVLNGYGNKNALEGNLLYFKTNFVSNNRSYEQLTYDLTKKCIPMLCVKENTHELINKNDEFMIYSNEEKTKFTCVYFDMFGTNYEQFISEISNIKEKKSLYIFSLDNQVNENELCDVKDYTIEPIPYEILEFYKKIIELSGGN